MTDRKGTYLPVKLQALRHAHAQAAQHRCDQAARARSVHEVEVVAREELVFVEGARLEWRGGSAAFFLSLGCGFDRLFQLELALPVGDFVHELLDHEEAGVAADATAVWERTGR